MRHLIRLVTPPQGVVLDPFLGSGTTAVAAVLEGFNWIGCELTEDYWPIIEARVVWAENQEPEIPTQPNDDQQTLF
jgi:site-specific DNA-methyltransferase (adenine-specific)